MYYLPNKKIKKLLKGTLNIMKTVYNRIEGMSENFINNIGEYANSCQILLLKNNIVSTSSYEEGFQIVFQRTGMNRDLIQNNKTRRYYTVKESNFKGLRTMKTEYNRIEEIVEKFLNEIAEYVDACQILLSNHDSDDTTFYDKGFGNYFARTGMIREFIEKDKARTNYSVKETEFTNNEDKDYE